MFPCGQAVRDFPEQRSDQQQDHHGDCQGDAAGAALILLLLLQHTMRTLYDPAGAMRNGAVPVGIAAGERSQEIGVCF